MPLIHYVLLALLGSATAAPDNPSTAPGTMLGPDAIVQPNGGVLVPAQNANMAPNINAGQNSNIKQDVKSETKKKGGRKKGKKKEDAPKKDG
jgi:hypothetical protein